MRGATAYGVRGMDEETLLVRAAALIEGDEDEVRKSGELGRQIQRWLQKRRASNAKPVRAYLTPLVIQATGIRRWKGVDVSPQAGSKDLLVIPRGRAREARHKLATKLVNATGEDARKLNAALIAVTVGIEVAEVNPEQVVVELSVSALNLIEEHREELSRKLRTIGNTSSQRIVTAEPEVMRELDGELRELVFEVVGSKQRSILNAQATVAKAIEVLEASENVESRDDEEES